MQHLRTVDSLQRIRPLRSRHRATLKMLRTARCDRCDSTDTQHATRSMPATVARIAAHGPCN
eukprot:9528519-Alexandrium_andersonii.AAC.1